MRQERTVGRLHRLFVHVAHREGAAQVSGAVKIGGRHAQVGRFCGSLLLTLGRFPLALGLLRTPAL